jgi:hypothetical protein
MYDALEGLNKDASASLPIETPSIFLHIPIFYLFPALKSAFGCAGFEYNHNATNPNHPATVTQMPEIHGQAPLITNDRGHSSCAKCRTVTVFFSSTFV